MKGIKENFKKFLQLEDDLQLFTKEICNTLFWEFVRFPIFNEIMQKSTDQIPLAVERQSRLIRLKLYLFSIFRIFSNPFLSRRKSVLFYGSSRRLLRADGYWWDIYTDYIIPRTKLPYLAVENHFKLTHKQPAKTKNLKYLDLLDFLLYLADKLGIKRIRLEKGERHLLMKLQRTIRERFDVDIDVEFIISRTLQYRRIEIPFFRILLRLIHPKVIVLVTSYGKESLIEVAKSLGIPVIELQHGIISPYHPAYSFPNRKMAKSRFPDFLFTFGDFWNSNAEFPIEAERIVSVGFPHLDEEMELNSDVFSTDQILFISQWNIGHILSKFAVELSNEKELKRRIVYKLHPLEYPIWKDKYPWLADSDIEVIDRSDRSLYSLFAESEVIVGGFSTAIIEGLSFGLRTFLLDVPGIGHLENLVEKGYVRKITSIRDFLSSIEFEPTMPETKRMTFFRKKSRNRAAELIRKIALRRISC